ncbi:MAG TPA: TonB-dependent receptor [Gallionella sp.]|nr:TonB-dependent receptor [Gallionella sp.]
MKQNLFITGALLGVLLLPCAGYAETPMQLLIVTPTRFPDVTGSTPVDVTVISADEIEKSAARTLPALLSEYAGIQVRSDDGTTDMAIDMRGFGMTGNQNTLVLLDGQPLNDIQLTSIRWSSIPLASIQRIEIMNGSGAVLYGGGATGGTINIITKHPGKEMRGSAGVGLGSYGTKEWQLALSGSGKRVGMRVTASGLDSSNYRANNDISQKNMEADVRTNAGYGDVVLKFGADNQSLRYPGARTVDPSIGLNQLVTDPRGTSTPLDYGKRDGGHVSLGTTQQFYFGQMASEISYRDNKQQAYFAAYGGSYLDTDLNLLSFTPRVKIPYQLGGSGNEMVIGADLADWNYDSIRSTSPTTLSTPTAHILATQSNRALYLQNTSQLGTDTKLTLGARSQQVVYRARDTVNPAAYASGDQSRTVNAYEVGLRQKLTQDLSLFGRIGHSFRIATVDEIFNQYGVCDPVTYVCNSKVSILEPQTSQDSEVGIDYRNGKNTMRVAVFQMNLNNEIYYNALTYTNMNLAPTRRSGLELEGTHNYTDALSVTASYSYTVAKFREGTYGGINVSGDNIPLVPRQRFSLSPSWTISDQTTLSGNVNYVGQQYFDNDPANTFGQKMPAYATVDMKLSHREGSWLLTAAVNNLFNRQYFTYGVASTFTPGRYNAYPMQQRNFLLNATYNF